MWAPASLIICLVSAETPFWLHRVRFWKQHFDLCSFIKHLKDWPCRNSKTPQRTQSGLKPSSLASLFPCWAIWLRWQPARLHSSSHFPMLTHFGDGGVSPFIDIDGGSQLQSIFTGALDASRLKGINWGTKSPVSTARTASLFLTDILMVQWGWGWSLFRLPS